MCRYVCCGCNMRSAHKVLGFEVVPASEETCCYIRVTVKNPTAKDGQFLCVNFRSIPTSLMSYPIKIQINDTDVDVVNHNDRAITTADLYECIMLSGMYTTDSCPKLTVC